MMSHPKLFGSCPFRLGKVTSYYSICQEKKSALSSVLPYGCVWLQSQIPTSEPRLGVLPCLEAIIRVHGWVTRLKESYHVYCQRASMAQQTASDFFSFTGMCHSCIYSLQLKYSMFFRTQPETRKHLNLSCKHLFGL